MNKEPSEHEKIKISKDLVSEIVHEAVRRGADQADACLLDHESIAVSCRLGKIDSLEGSSSGDLGLRVFLGKKQALVSTSDRKKSNLLDLIDRAVRMAHEAPDDPYCGLADQALLAKKWSDLHLADQYHPTAKELIEQAKEMEEAALATHGVTNSDGSDASASLSQIYFATSHGFCGHYSRTRYGLSIAVLAGEGLGMERDYDYATEVVYQKLPKPELLGRKAAERAVGRLGSKKMPTSKVPVVFDSRISGSLVSSFLGAISGDRIAKGTSFLKDKLGEEVFSNAITIRDDPFRSEGLRSRPFDGEGLLPKPMNLIDKGRLTTWLLDCRSARQLGLASTGHASRSASGLPSPSASNCYLEAGTDDPVALIADIKEGFYVTEMMGMGINGVTGDYSQAASGFWIVNGIISFPVSEMTIAGNLKEMFRHVHPANDLEFRRGIDAPTLRIEDMTVAGL